MGIWTLKAKEWNRGHADTHIGRFLFQSVQSSQHRHWEGKSVPEQRKSQQFIPLPILTCSFLVGSGSDVCNPWPISLKITMLSCQFYGLVRPLSPWVFLRHRVSIPWPFLMASGHCFPLSGFDSVIPQNAAS